MAETKFYRCIHCGNIITFLHSSGVPVMCCGEKMQELAANTSDGAAEKHVPVAAVAEKTVTVSVGSVAHPMLAEHYIQWIFWGQALLNLAAMSLILLAVCVLAYGALKLAGFFSGEKKPVAQLEEQKRPDSTPDFNVSLAEPPKAELRFIECAGGLKLPEGMACPETKPEAQAQAAPEPPKGPTEEEILQKRRFESEIGVGGGKPPPGGAASARARAPNLSGDTGLGGALLSTATARTLATVNRNPSFTLAKGTLPDCTLLTAISTDQPGFLKCILSRPVYSMDGKVVLMEAGTTFEGEYSAGMARGKKRMFAVWSRAITPNFVEVTLNSPSTDALGRSGMSGQVDQHFFERFGGAMLYSLFSDGMDYVMRREELRSQERDARNAAANGDNNTVYYNNQGGALRNLDRTRSTADRVVESMLSQGEDIQPTLYKNQGEIIKIYIARDVDFSQVYELTRNPRS